MYNAEKSISFITISPDNTLIAFGTNGVDEKPGEIGILDVKKGKLIASKLDFIQYIGFQANSIAFRDNKTLIYATAENEIKQWSWKKNKSTTLAKNVGSSFAISPNNIFLASSNEKQAIVSKIDEPNQKIILEGKVEHPIKLHAQIGDYLYVEYPSGLRKWNLRELNTEMVIEKFYEKDWRKIFFSPDGKYIINGNYIYRSDGTPESIYTETYDPIHLAAFSNDNTRFVSITEEGNISLQKIEKDSLGDNQLKAIKDWKYDGFYTLNNINNLVLSANGEQCAVLSSGFDLFGVNDSTNK